MATDWVKRSSERFGWLGGTRDPMMPTSSKQASLRPIKSALREAGFMVYRAEADTVVIAERVRENLILDSGVRVGSEPLRVSFEAYAQRSHHPNLNAEALFAMARALGEAARGRGFVEVEAAKRDMPDPSDPERVLDQQFVVVFEREVHDLEAAMGEVAFALELARHD